MRTKPTVLPGKSLGVTLLTAVLLVGTAFADDRIIFIDDFVMDAIVVGYDPVMGNVTLEVARGTVSIPKKRIKQVDYDTTIARTLDDDTAKAVALAESIRNETVGMVEAAQAIPPPPVAAVLS